MKNSFFSRFTPQEPKFFPMLKRLSEILTSSSDLLVESMQHDKPEEREKTITNASKIWNVKVTSRLI